MDIRNEIGTVTDSDSRLMSIPMERIKKLYGQLKNIRSGFGTIIDSYGQLINIPMEQLKKLYVAYVHAFYYI